tara:strand:+ start:171 stop:1007 length:837 start_codon:yes stop_codon:yes gene_type:complete
MGSYNKKQQTSRKGSRKKSRTVKKTRRHRTVNKSKRGGFGEGLLNFVGIETSKQKKQNKRVTAIIKQQTDLHKYALPEKVAEHSIIQYLLEIYDKCVELIFHNKDGTNKYKMNDLTTILKNIDTDLDENTKDIVEQAKTVIRLLPENMRYNIQPIELTVDDNKDFVNRRLDKIISQLTYVDDIVSRLYNNPEYQKYIHNTDPYEMLFKSFYKFQTMTDMLNSFVKYNEDTGQNDELNDLNIISKNVTKFFDEFAEVIMNKIRIYSVVLVPGTTGYRGV